jgi:hypothetical protein
MTTRPIEMRHYSMRPLPYDVPQAWSAALHAHPTNADGIAFHARHDDTELCYALFERSAAGLLEAQRQVDLDQDRFWGWPNGTG